MFKKFELHGLRQHAIIEKTRAVYPLCLYFRVPTSSGNHGKPGISLKNSSMHEKIMEFEKNEYSWENHGIL